MAAEFKVDAFQLKCDAAGRMQLRGDSTETRDANVQATFELIDQAVEIDDFTTATRLATALSTVKGLASQQSAEVQKRGNEIKVFRREFESLAPQREILKKIPNDPAANLALGRYNCFTRDRWALGLPMLARGSDAALKAIAARDIGYPDDAAEQLALATEWWDMATKERSAPTQQSMRRRATYWYGEALPGLIGLNKVLADKRVAEIAAADPQRRASFHSGGPRIVHLLPLIQDRDLAQAGWHREGTTVVSHVDNDVAVMTVPYALPLEYDLHYEFTRVSGNEINDIVVTFPVGGVTDCALAVGSGPNAVMGPVSGHWPDNPTRVACPIHNGERHAVVVKVRGGRLESTIDGRPLNAYDTDGHDLLAFPSQRGNASPAFITIGSFKDAVVAFHSVDVVEVSGHGAPGIRDADGTWVPPLGIAAGTDGVFSLRPFTATWHGLHPDYVHKGDDFALGGWRQPSDFPAWVLQNPHAGKYNVKVQYSCNDDTAGSTVELSVNDGQAVSLTVSSTSGWSKPTEETLTNPDGTPATLTIPAGRSTLRVRCTHMTHYAVMDTWKVTLVPVKAQ